MPSTEHYTLEDLLDDLWAQEQDREPVPTDADDVELVPDADPDDNEYFINAHEHWRF